MSASPLFGRSIGLNMDYKVLTDSTKDVKSDAVVYAGRALALNSDSLLVDYGNDATSGGAGNVRIHGLARANKNQFVNETSGQTFGSGKVDCAMMGIVTLKSNVFSDTVTGSDVEKHTFDTSLTYLVGDALYVNQGSDATKRGLATNVKSTSGPDQNDETFIGWVLRVPTASDVSMQVLMVPKSA